jgi:RNA polymerase sigma-70 factor (ECF subfamily)
MMKKVDVTEQQLIKGCIDGISKYQEMLYYRFAKEALTLCKRYAKNEAEAEDLLQDAFIKIFLNLKSFRNESSLKSWINRIVINTAISHVRKKTVWNEINESEELDNSEAVMIEEADVPMDVLMEMIQKLPETYRIVFNMREIDDLEYSQIADHLHVTESTVRANLTRAKSKLKQWIIDWMKKNLDYIEK